MDIELNKPFAGNGGADEYDVRQMKKALNRLGYYMPYDKTGITGIPDRAVFTALKSFQKDTGLRATGTAKPGDETMAALNGALAKKPDGQYVWRTVGDSRVRPEHAALDGTVRDFSDSPNPGDEINCRCWAEPVTDAINPVYPELFLIPALRAKSALNVLELSASRIMQNMGRSRIKMDDTRTWPKPPAVGKYREGLPSRQKPRMRGEKSLYDEKNGEWRYAGEDKYHNPHWDYKESPSSSWKNIQIDDKPILKNGR